MMRRREFITLLGGAAAAWPLTVYAQPGKLPTIGVMGATPSVWQPWNAAFLQRLSELGWIEGRTVAVEYRWVEGRRERFGEIAAEFVRRKVDVIVTFGSAVPAAKLATSTIPIVFAMANDPVGGGLVASLARPGGNVTGLSVQASDLAGKRLELMREILPDLRRLAVIADVGYRDSVLVIDELEAAARTLNIDVFKLGIRRAEEIAPVLTGLKSEVEALYVVISALVAANHAQINALAMSWRLPTMYNNRGYVAAGGFMSYGPSYPDLFRRAAEIVHKILRGAKPADIPVEQPTKFDLVFNLKTAKAIGLTVPPMLLARADEVIE
jgi:putative ABC transport system substrate-binding protein